MEKETLNKPASELPPTEDKWLSRSDFRTSSHWRIFRIMAEFVEGWQFLADYVKTVTFFGSAKTKKGTRWYNEALKLSRMLAEDGYSVVTGGGPGIMEAANKGAWLAKHKARGISKKNIGESVGLDIQLPYEQRKNRYISKSRGFHYFFVRKVMLSYHAQAYIFFPGGLGTMDETFELLTLIQTHKINPVPVILVGKKFWSPMASWMKKTMLEEFKAIDKEDLELFHVADNAGDAYKIIKNWHRNKKLTAPEENQ